MDGSRVPSQIQIEDLTIAVTRKTIKHAYLRVDGDGRVRMSAPKRMPQRELEAFARSKLGWIRRQQQKARSRPRPVQHKYASGEEFLVWGRTARLQVVETKGRPAVELRGAALRLAVRPGTGRAKRATLIEAWYRAQLEAAVPPLLARWEPRLGVKLAKFSIRTMKTRWGSCSTAPRTIRLNSELVHLPPDYLEYVVVHELAHLLEPSHNARFKALLDKHLPGWRATRKRLNGHALGRSLQSRLPDPRLEP
jgi:predicted metal-dependent hydrolase